MTQPDLPLITCSGTPREMGRQYGEQAAESIRHNLERFTEEPSEVMLRIMVKVLSDHAPELLEELEGTAESAHVDFRRLLAYNHWALNCDDAERCTVLALHSTDAGLLIAKNNDSPCGEDGRFLLRRGFPDKGLPFLQVTYAGFLSGLDMVNAAGLCNTHGSVGSSFARNGERFDIRLKLYQLMQTCRSVDELIVGLNSTPLTGKGFSIAAGDQMGNSLFIDAAVPFIAEHSRNKTFAYSTNLYQYPGLENADMRPPERRSVCLYRHGYLKWIEHTDPPETLANLQHLLASHAPWAPCRHGGMHGSVTDWSVIFLPQKGEILIAGGPPCQKQYKTVTL